MSLCYDFEKHTMITFAIVTNVLIIGLIMLVDNKANGQNQTNEAKFIECIQKPNPESATFDILLDMYVDCLEIRQGYEGYKGDYYCLHVSKLIWEECQLLKLGVKQNESMP